MKKLLLTVAVLSGMLAGSYADDVALVTLRVGKDKIPLQFAMEFDEAAAPNTVANFKKLADKGFYKNTTIHRAFPHLLVQMGDPLSKDKDRSKIGTGGPGYTVDPEIRKKFVKGTIGAARLPDKINPSRVSNGSQFFVCLAPMPAYDGQYTAFGKLIWGVEVLDALSTTPVDSNDNPIQRIAIRSVKIMPREQLPPQPAPVVPTAPTKKPWWKIW
jgi:cyclophilin family peptidyl-prolyl cis-trans isomerase